MTLLTVLLVWLHNIPELITGVKQEDCIASSSPFDHIEMFKNIYIINSEPIESKS